MDFDFTTLAPEDRYRLLTNFVGPRPIALVTTRSADGVANAAPMSFFNVFGHDPAILALGIQPRLDGRQKDTVANMRETGQFVVHVVDAALAQAMLVCGLGVEPDVDELDLAGLQAVPSVQLTAPRIAGAACAMECRVERIIDWPRRALVLGEVVQMHVRDDCLDAEGRYVNPEVYQPIARLHADNYVTSDRQIVMTAPPLADVLAARAARPGK
ncbi:flavin reductase family protein [Gemmobacter sp.]|uniref:flavin reductase family protein n=1 Tax=Gemmobacter sp. TaxID=1898957 RepID=UPI002AFE68A1|nr:flavin reductase family protein [Gemmobacter sp.]